MSQTPSDLPAYLEKLHFLKAHFPEWTGEDAFFLEQLLTAIEACLSKEPSLGNDFEAFKKVALDLDRLKSSSRSQRQASIILDFSATPWSPLFARNFIISELKSCAGVPHIFICIKGLRLALAPKSRYFTQNRQKELNEAVAFIDDLVAKWSTPSSHVHLLYE